jgi:hypothetical protein
MSLKILELFYIKLCIKTNLILNCVLSYCFTQSLKVRQRQNVCVNVAYVAHCASLSTAGVMFSSHCLATGVIALMK